MNAFDELIMFGVAVLSSALSLSYYMVHKGRQKNQPVQGVVGVLSGLTIFISLFFPWVSMGNSQISGLEVGQDVFAEIVKTQFVTAIMYFLLFLAILIILGGFLHIIGYKLAKEIIGYASGLALFLSVIIALALSAVPLEQMPITLELSPWICIFGGVLGLISTRLER